MHVWAPGQDTPPKLLARSPLIVGVDACTHVALAGPAIARSSVAITNPMVPTKPARLMASLPQALTTRGRESTCRQRGRPGEVSVCPGRRQHTGGSSVGCCPPNQTGHQRALIRD